MPKPKRDKEEELKRWYKKLKRLERKIKGYSTINLSTASNMEGNESQGETQDGDYYEERGGAVLNPVVDAEMPEYEQQDFAPEPEPIPGTASAGIEASSEPPTISETLENTEVIDPELLIILGDPAPENKKFGPNISENLASRWTPILIKGLSKEVKENVIKIYLVPSNCELLQSPALNPEIGSAISDAAKNRDKKLEQGQQQLGIGLTALGRAMSLAFKDYQGEKIQIVKHMNDAGKILADLHFNETRSRKQLITPILDKNFLDVVKDVDHDEYLYGKNLIDKIKTLKSIERSSLSIKKMEHTKSAPHSYPSSSKKQGNYSNPPRYPHQYQHQYQQRYPTPSRGTARGGFRRPQLPPRRPAPAPASFQHKKDPRARN